MHFRITAVLLTLIAAIFVFGLRLSNNAAAQIANQSEARLIKANADLDSPLKISSVKAKSGKLETNSAFIDDDDWLKGLTIRISNHSQKSVTFAEILLTFHRTKDQPSGVPAGWPVKVGVDPFRPEILSQLPIRPVAPGEEKEIFLSDTEYGELKLFLKDVQFPDSIKKVEIEVVRVGFEDDTLWDVGHFYRRDPKTVEGPGLLKGWTPIKEPEEEGTQLKRPIGSTRNRTAFSSKGAVDHVDLGDSWQFLKAGWNQPLLQSTGAAKPPRLVLAVAVDFLSVSLRGGN